MMDAVERFNMTDPTLQAHDQPEFLERVNRLQKRFQDCIKLEQDDGTNGVETMAAVALHCHSVFHTATNFADDKAPLPVKILEEVAMAVAEIITSLNQDGVFAAADVEEKKN